MKKIVLSLAIIIACLSAKSQLANHKFEGSIQIDSQPTDVILDFKKDSVNAIIKATGELLEAMTYTAKNGVVTFQKVTGKSECGTDIVGKYKFSQTSGAITLMLTEDICADRANVLDKSVWKKQAK